MSTEVKSLVNEAWALECNMFVCGPKGMEVSTEVKSLVNEAWAAEIPACRAQLLQN